MHSESVAPWQKPHAAPSDRDRRNARRATAVLILTVVMMAAEITGGTLFHSMALLADGWHMASHAAALGIAAFAFSYARRHAENSHYSFGTGKVNDLAGFSSALLLLVIAALMAFESVQRLISPEPIAFNEALFVAVVGLIVNLVSAWMLRDDHHHGHDHGHAHNHGHAHDDHAHDDHGHGHAHDHDHAGHAHDRDNNMRAAYIHVVTDAVTSVLAIAALGAGVLWNVTWLDAAMGIVGALIIGQWSWSLIAATSRILLDAAPADGTALAVRAAIEAENDNRIADLHVWRLGPGHLAAVVTVVTHQQRTPAHYKDLLARIPSLSHVTIEVERCCNEQPHAA